MELRHLRYFVATAQAEHFTRAAQQLGIAQPPLSQQIRELEKEIGTPLFDRVGRGVVLNSVGKVFLKHALDILARVDDAMHTAQRAARGEAGVLRIGFTESASFNDLVTHTISLYQHRHPEVEVSLEESDSESLIASLGDKTIDAAFVRPPFSVASGIHFVKLAEESLVVVLPNNHPLAAQTRLQLRDLHAERFIIYARKSGYGLSADIISACRQNGFNPDIGQRAPQLSSAVNLVAAGMGIAVIPASMRCMQPAGVTYRPLDSSWPKAVLGLATRRGETSSVVSNLLQLVSEASDGRTGALDSPTH